MISIRAVNLEQAMAAFEAYVEMTRIDGQDESFYGGKANKLSGDSVIEIGYAANLNSLYYLHRFLSYYDRKNAAIALTFSAPKSLSILIELTDDMVLREKLIEMHDNAMCKTMGYIENNLIVTRVSKGENMRGRRINALVPPAKGIEWAAFRHHISAENDPHLFTQTLVANHIYIKKMGREYSIDARDLYNYQIALGKTYRTELCNSLLAAGISVKVTDYKNFFFTIEGIRGETMQIFSKQSKNIDTVFRELKEEFPDEPEAKLKEIANLESRPEQIRTKPLKELRTRWKEEYPQKHINYVKKSFILANTEDVAKAFAEGMEIFGRDESFSDLDLRNITKQILIYKGFRFDEAAIRDALKEAIKKHDIKEIGKNMFIRRGNNGFDRQS